MFSINKCRSCKHKVTKNKINYCAHPGVIEILDEKNKALPDCRFTRINVCGILKPRLYEYKICKDCKYNTGAFCSHPVNISKPDMVTGNVICRSCNEARGGTCSIEAKLFESKE